MLVTKWDHTALVAANIYNLTVTVINAVSKRKAKPKTFSDFHPYREVKKQGVIRQDNFQMLRIIGNCIVQQKG